MNTLVACYPHLEVLSLDLSAPSDMEPSAAKAVWRESLVAAPVVAPLCPSPREVHVKVFVGSRFLEAAWLRPRA